MNNFRRFLQVFSFQMIASLFFCPADLPDNLVSLQGKLGNLKEQLKKLSLTLGNLRDELGKKPPETIIVEEIIAKIDKSKALDRNSSTLSATLLSIKPDTEEKEKIFVEHLAQEFLKVPKIEAQLNDAIEALIETPAPKTQEEKIIHQAIVHAFESSMSKSLETAGKQEDAIQKLVDLIDSYDQKKSTAIIPALANPTAFLSQQFKKIKDPQVLTDRLNDKFTEKKEQLHEQILINASKMSTLQKQTLNSIKLTLIDTIDDNFIKIAQRLPQAMLHPLFQDKTKTPLEKFEKYLEENDLDKLKRDPIIDFLKNLTKNQLTEILKKKDHPPSSLAYIKILLTFLGEKKLLDIFNEKFNPKTPIAVSIANIWNKKTNKIDEILKEEEKINESLEEKLVSTPISHRIETLCDFLADQKIINSATKKINPNHLINSFIPVFKEIEKLKSYTQKTTLKEIIRSQIINGINEKIFKADYFEAEYLQKINDIKESPLTVLGEKENKVFSKRYSLFFRNVFAEIAKKQAYFNGLYQQQETSLMEKLGKDATEKKTIIILDYLNDVFSCFDRATKILLFKEKEQILATITEKENLLKAINNHFQQVLKAFYTKDQAFLFNQLITLFPKEYVDFSLLTQTQELKEIMKKELFGEWINNELSFCTNSTINEKKIKGFDEKTIIEILKNVINAIKELEKLPIETIDIDTEIKNLKKLKGDKLDEKKRELIIIKQRVYTSLKTLKKFNFSSEKRTENITVSKKAAAISHSSVADLFKEMGGTAKAAKPLQRKWQLENKLFSDANAAAFELCFREQELNIENKTGKEYDELLSLNDLDNLEQAIIENRGGNWHTFIQKNDTLRSLIRSTLFKLKYSNLIKNTITTIIQKIDNDEVIDLDGVIYIPPQYSEHWMILIDRISAHVDEKIKKLKCSEDKLLEESLAIKTTMLEKIQKQPENVRNYLSFEAYLKLTIIEKFKSNIIEQLAKNIVKMIEEKKKSQTEVDSIEKYIPNKTSSWYSLIQKIVKKITKINNYFFKEFIEEKPNSPLLVYLGKELFHAAVMNEAYYRKNTADELPALLPKTTSKPLPTPPSTTTTTPTTKPSTISRPLPTPPTTTTTTPPTTTTTVDDDDDWETDPNPG